MKPNKFSLKSRFGSFKFAFNGLGSIVKNEHNFRIHLFASIIAIAFGIVLKINYLEWSLIIIVIGVVFLTELLNSSLETLADLIEPEWNDNIRKAKDYGASAVLISAIISAVVGALIFIPKLFK